MKARVYAGAFALAVLLTASAAMAAPIQVSVNGAPVQFPDQQPVSIQNRILVPLRGVLEAMGARVEWNAATQGVLATRGATTVQLAVGSRDASVNQTPVTLDVPAQMIGGRVMVPLRFISEALGANVGWSDLTQTVSISLPPVTGTAGAGIPGTTAGGALATTGGGVGTTGFPERGVNGGATTSGAPGATTGNPGTNLGPGTTGGRAVPNGVTPTTAGAPVSNQVVINAFSVNGAGPFHPGDAIKVQMQGTPGGKAFFTVGATGAAVAMPETTPGNYAGTYVVPAGAHGENLSIIGRLEKNGLSSPLVVAAQPITMEALPPQISQFEPAPGSVTTNVRPTIYALFTAGSAPITPAGVRLVVAEPGGTGVNVTPRATITPAFVSYTPDHDLAAGRVLVNVSATDASGLRADRTWSFTVRPQEGIKSLVLSPTGPLGAGDVLTVTLTGAPGGQAWFAVPGVVDRVNMAPTATEGQYVGTYTVRRGDQLLGQPVTAHLDVNGMHLSQKSTAPVTLWTKAAGAPAITSPLPNAKVGGNLQVTGTADPLSKVHVKVTYSQTVLGIFQTGGTVADETVNADAAGHFQTAAIPLSGVLGTAGVQYTITATETDPAGQESAPTSVQVTS